LELKGYIIRSTTEAARQYWPSPNSFGPPFFNFRLEHIRQVERDALHLLSKERGDEDILLAAVWIHDRFQPQFFGAQHAQKAAHWTRNNLAYLGFPEHKVEAVARAVELHTRQTMDIRREEREAQLLWDADRLARLGPMNLISYLMCHLCDDFLVDLVQNPEFRSGSISIKDFAPLLLEKRNPLFQSDWFYFDESRILARKRIAVTREFLDALEGQVY
jgi:uncharacterized protein